MRTTFVFYVADNESKDESIKKCLSNKWVSFHYNMLYFFNLSWFLCCFLPLFFHYINVEYSPFYITFHPFFSRSIAFVLHFVFVRSLIWSSVKSSCFFLYTHYQQERQIKEAFFFSVQTHRKAFLLFSFLNRFRFFSMHNECSFKLLSYAFFFSTFVYFFLFFYKTLKNTPVL